MNTIKKLLNQKLLSLLEGNIAISSDRGVIYIDGKEGIAYSEKLDVMATLMLSYKDWMYVLTDKGSLGMLVVSGKASVTGDIGLVFKLSELIG